MKKNIYKTLLLAFCLLLLLPGSKAQWNQIYTFNDQMNDLWFVDKDNGYICGGYSGPSLQTTTNGGFTWEDMTGSFTESLLSVLFTDPATGFVTTYGTSGSAVYKTTNQGYSWQLKYQYVPPMHTLTFPTPLVGYTFPSIMEYIDVVKTLDGGETWSKISSFQTLGAGFGVTDCFFTSEDYGFLVTDEGSIFRTVNGGLTFTQRFNAWNYSFTGVHFTTPDTGFVTGYISDCFTNCGLLLKTTNGGTTWSTDFYPWKIFDVYFTKKDTGYLATDKIYKTTDGGNSWIPQISNIEGYFGKLNFPTKEIGYSLNGPWLWKTNPDVGVGIRTTDPVTSFRIIPVPASGKITCLLELPLQTTATIDLLDSYGQPVKSLFRGLLSTGKHSLTSDLTGIPVGFYLCRLTTNKGKETKKVVISK
ncbi:MAG: YCF48-related protein [Bacteroidetes bacterium]|nr:YCF48-related protein [Bacteroidota bacterium]